MVYRYSLGPEIQLDEAEHTLHLAIYSTEGIHGAARVRLEAGYHLDAESRICILEASTEVGETVGRIFTALLSREFGEDQFNVQRMVGEDATCARSAVEPAGVA